MKEKGKDYVLPEVREGRLGGKAVRRRTPSTGSGSRKRGGDASFRLSWDMGTPMSTQPSSIPLPLSPSFSSLLQSLPSNCPLPFELEVTYRLLRDSDPPKARSPTGLLTKLHTSIPHSKKRPQSLYNSGKNESSWEFVTCQPEIRQRIKEVAQGIGSGFRYNAQVLESSLMNCFQSSIDTECKAYYAIWDQLLHSFEPLLAVPLPSVLDPCLSSLLSTLPSCLSTQSPWLERVTSLSQSVRLVLVKLADKQQAQALEQLWAYCVAVSWQALHSPAPPPSAHTPSDNPEKGFDRGLSLSLQREIAALRAENDRLKASNARFQADAEHYVSLIKDRESEIREIRSISNTRELDRFTQELMDYLTDAEGRQVANTETLETISQLLNHRWTSPTRKNTRKLTSKGVARGVSPVSLRVKTTSEDAPAAPMKRPSGIQAFFPHSGHQRAGSPKSAVESRREDWVEKLLEMENPTLGVDKQTAPGGVTGSAKDVLAVQDSGLPLDVAAQGNSSTLDTERHTQAGDPASVEEVKEEPEESESESEVPVFVDSDTQTDLTMATFPPNSLPAGLSPLPKPALTRKQKQNLLLLQLEKLERRQPPMPSKGVFKLFESAMDEKNHSDNLELEAGRPTRTMTEFMLDFMYMQYGLKTLTLKNLSAFVNALEGMARDQHPYGTLLCRLLEVFTEDPIDETLTAFLVKARSAFGGLLNKWKGNLPKGQLGEDGGKLPLSDVADLIFVLFLSDREAGEQVLARLFPTSLSDTDRAGLLFCGKLAKAGRELKYFYIQIDSDKTGSVKYPAFEKGVREACEVPASRAQTLALWLSLNTESLSYQQLSKLPFKDYASRAQGKDLMVSKCDFLLEIALEYQRKRDREREELTQLFLSFAPSEEKALSLEDFRALLSSLNASISESQQVSIFREALDHTENPLNLDSLDPAAFCHIALKYRLGKAGQTLFDVDIKQLSDRLRDQFVHYEHEQGNMAVATNKFRNEGRRVGR